MSRYTITFEAVSDEEAQVLYTIFFAMCEARKANCMISIEDALGGDENITYVDIDKARQVKKPSMSYNQWVSDVLRNDKALKK